MSVKYSEMRVATTWIMSGPDSDGHEKEKVGMIRAHENNKLNRKHQSSCRREDKSALGEDVTWVAVEGVGHCQKIHESMEDRG